MPRPSDRPSDRVLSGRALAKARRQGLDDAVTAGAARDRDAHGVNKTLDHDPMTSCCGTVSVYGPDKTTQLIEQFVESAVDAGADVIATPVRTVRRIWKCVRTRSTRSLTPGPASFARVPE